MKRHLLFSVLATAIVIQFIPIDRSNPPVTGEVPAPPNVRQVFERSCRDCHSNETFWPWYSYVAPVSWLVAHDVDEGREHLNLSEWDGYAPDKQQELREEVWEEVEEGDMPLWFYTPLHPGSSLSDEDRELLRSWSEQAGPGEDAS